MKKVREKRVREEEKKGRRMEKKGGEKGKKIKVWRDSSDRKKVSSGKFDNSRLVLG